jgi:hypothetical protein
MSQKVLLITPPFTQLNTPYPATTYLKGFLNTKNISSFQCDLGIEVILRLFSATYLQKIFKEEPATGASPNTWRIFSLRETYITTIDPVIHFLQDRNPTLAHSICEGNFLPQASRFDQPDDLEWAFGTMGTRDKARHLATLYLEDISDYIVSNIDPFFGFSRYAERIATAAATFDELYGALQQEYTLVEEILISLLEEKITKEQPTVVALSVPFPGNLVSALRCGQHIKKHHPRICVVLGGGYANTELRNVTDARVFEFIDFISLDDGEAPLENLLQHLDGKREQSALKRTLALENGEVVCCNGSTDRDYPQHNTGTPDYSDLHLEQYLSVIEIANPMHRMWSDGRWNKLTMAHGCYWGKCTFCDISLDYIKRYEPSTAAMLCDKMETIIQQTGETGFHFVDEAAPPALMRDLALEIIRRKLTVSWWTNIRFEKSFSRDLCILLRESGCIAVSGGLEVASDRLLQLIEKGVTVAQVAKVAGNFTSSGIMVHAYLMFGFPTQTARETIDSLEMVRQLFMNGVLQSGFWHQFAMTAHSPVGLEPAKFMAERLHPGMNPFANNDLAHDDPTGTDHHIFSEGLRKSLFNYMHGIGFDLPLSSWFSFKVPGTSVPPAFIEQALAQDEFRDIQPSARLTWIGGPHELRITEKAQKGRTLPVAGICITGKKKDIEIITTIETGRWISEMLPLLSPGREKMTYAAFRDNFEKNNTENFLMFWHGKTMTSLRESGLLVL